MNSIDQVWDRLADRAVLHAQSGILVSMADARRIVTYLCAECTDGPGDQAIEDLAGELVRLTLEATDRLQRRHRKSVHGIC
jgi:hypothetical protein